MNEPSSKTISLVMAISNNHVIGHKNKLPWHLPKDLKYFKKLTVGHSILMGRKTYESIGRPLPKRANLVLSGQENFQAPGCQVFSSFEKALSSFYLSSEKQLFIIGGVSVYEQAFSIAHKLYITRVYGEVEGDVFFSHLDLHLWKEKKCISNFADSKHQYDFSWYVYSK